MAAAHLTAGRTSGRLGRAGLVAILGNRSCAASTGGAGRAGPLICAVQVICTVYQCDALVDNWTAVSAAAATPLLWQSLAARAVPPAQLRSYSAHSKYINAALLYWADSHNTNIEIAS